MDEDWIGGVLIGLIIMIIIIAIFISKWKDIDFKCIKCGKEVYVLFEERLCGLCYYELTTKEK